MSPNRLKEHRSRLGMSCAAVAQAAGMSAMEVNRIERGIRRLNETTLKKLSRALGVSPTELLGDVHVPGSEESRGNLVHLDDAERMILRFWRTLPDERKERVLINMVLWSTEVTAKRFPVPAAG